LGEGEQLCLVVGMPLLLRGIAPLPLAQSGQHRLKDAASLQLALQQVSTAATRSVCCSTNLRKKRSPVVAA
jgi:hypothetical protein